MIQYPGIKVLSDETIRAKSEATKRNWQNPRIAERYSSYWRSAEHAKKKSEEFKKRWESEERSDIIESQAIGRLRPEVRQRRRELATVWSRKLHQNPEYLRTKSQNSRQQMLGYISRNIIRGHRVSYGSTTYRSTWEVTFAKYCDSKGLKYEYESYRFSYTYQGVQRLYIPDFYLPSLNLMIEIKPACRFDEIAKMKFESIPSVYKKILITEHELFNPDILDSILRPASGQLLDENSVNSEKLSIPGNSRDNSEPSPVRQDREGATTIESMNLSKGSEASRVEPK